MLFVLQLIMLLTLLFGIEPHPPKTFPPISGMAPFLAASFAFLVAAYILDPLASRAGWGGFALISIPMAMVSFGPPQKYSGANWSLIWPAVLCAQGGASLLLAGQLIAAIKDKILRAEKQSTQVLGGTQ